MKAEDYPQIKLLEELYKKYKVNISIIKDDYLGGNKDYPAVKFSLGGKSFDLYIDDEYEDLRFNYPLLNLCMVLRELEYYKSTYDYLLWCNENKFDPGTIQVLHYYRSLGATYREIEAILGEINSQISDWDFEMNAGAGHYIRQANNMNPNK